MPRKNRSVEIEQQLAHLRWRRLQNERGIRNALETTKQMQENDTMHKISVNHAGEKKNWISSVIENEVGRPLVLIDSDMSKLMAPSSLDIESQRKSLLRAQISSCK